VTSRPKRISIDVEAVGAACFVFGLILAPSLADKLVASVRQQVADE
jgi:hypothetical protein